MVNKKDFILKHERILSKIYRLLGRNKIHAAKNNELKINNAFLKRCCISIGGYGNCRINPSHDVNIGNHVWIGHGVKILKGVSVLDNSIIATGAICTNKQFPENCILGGIPAKIIKSGITWKAQRISTTTL